MSAGAIRAGRAFVELFADDAQLQRGLKSAQAKLRAFGNEVRAVGSGLTAIGGAITSVFAIAARQFAGFDDSMRAVGAVTGATADDMVRLREEAKRLGRTTSFTAKQVADAMTELGRAGFVADEILKSSDAVLSLARATSTELPRATEIAGAALRGFALSADEMPRVADVLTATANKSAQTLEDLFESFKVTAPLAVEAGESIEDVAAALGVLANNGIKGSLAGNALARVYKNLSTELKQQELRNIGVQAVDAAGNLRPMVDILNDVADATREMGNTQRMSIFESLFGRGQAAALKLAGGAASVRELEDAIRDAGGVAQKTAEAMDAGLGGSFRKMLSAAEGVAISIGEAIAGPLSQWSDKVAVIAGKVTAWVEENRDLVVSVGKIGARLLALGVTLVATGTLMASLTSIIGGVNLAAKGLGVTLTFLSAHPIIAASLVIAAGIAGIGYALSRASRSAGDLADELARTSEQAEQMRQRDRERIEQLQRLADKQKLSNDEMSQARNLIALLSSKYGQLGLQLDETEQKLLNVAEAQQRLNRKMATARFAELFEQRDARRTNADDLEQRIERLQQQMNDPRMAGETEWHKGAVKAMQRMRARMAKELDAINAIQEEIEDLRTGMSDEGADGPPKPPKNKPDAPPGGDLPDDALTRRLAQLRLQLIEDRYQREVALINERYDHERQQAEGNAAKQDQLDQARYLELEKLSQEHSRQMVAEMNAAADRQEELDARRAEAIASADTGQANRVAELQIIASTDDEYERTMQLLDLREKIAIEAAKAAGHNIDLVREEFDLLRQIEAARRATSNALDIAGSLGGQRIEQMVGARILSATGSKKSEDRTAKATEAVAKIMPEVMRGVRDMTMYIRRGTVFS